MLLLYYTHSLLFYLGLSAFQSNNELTKSLHSFDYDYLPQEVCVAKCLQERKMLPAKQILPQSYDGLLMQESNNGSLRYCLDECVPQNATNPVTIEGQNRTQPPKQIQENYSFNLICRDDTSFNFKIDLHTTEGSRKLNANQTTEIETFAVNSTISSNRMETTNEREYETVFVIKIHLTNNADKIFVYLSDENFITLDKLLSNTTYNISVLAVHSNNKYSVITQQQQFKTLRRSYTPGNVTEIKITHFTEDKLNKMHLIATLTWKPATDMTCHYNIICFSPESEDYDLQPLEIRNPRQLYKYQLENLTFSSVYKVGIRASNTKSMRESELFWKTFTVPSCVEWHNYNFNICAPEAPQNLKVEQIIVDQYVYSLNVSWQLPKHLPDNYTLRVQDLSVQGEAKIYNLTKDAHSFFIPQIYFYGVFYEVCLTAYTRGGLTTTSFTDIVKTVVHMPEKNPFVKLIAVILAPIFCVAILALTIFIFYHRRAKLRRYQERCKYFEELERKAPIDPKNNFDFSANLKRHPNDFLYPIDCQEPTPTLLYDDEMEIDRNDLMLYQVLGEGAFGLVKLGLYKDRKLGTAQQVAVKMLKDHPSADDIYAFRREIEVMKSVEKHPNIVGIIGHCTRFTNQMMLITEYCSFGNLLNFLRDEWHFLHKLQIRKQEKAKRRDIAYIDLNQDEETSSQELHSFSNSPLHSVGTQSGKTKLKHEHEHEDNDVDYQKNHRESGTNDVIEHFKMRYSGINETTSSRISLANNHSNSHINNNNNNNNCETTNLHHQKTQFRHVNATNKETNDPTKQSVLSPATENKSYGYHGFCTNSCKCNVDVIIKSPESLEVEKQIETLETQSSTDSNTTTCADSATVIRINNCDCKMKEISPGNGNRFNGAVENKSYFKLFSSSDNKYLTRRNQRNTQSNKLKSKAKSEQIIGNVAKKDYTANDDEDGGGGLEGGGADVKDINTNHSNRVPLSTGDLLHIARQVAVGMEFLAKNKVVHRDLAARNVLVAPDRTIKIADFGLSRDVYQENMYKKTGNGKLPIKWLALESMTHQVYTTQSDVWSYGILLYEIVTLGATPYPSISTNRLLHLLKSGYRMEKPKGCDQELYNLMYSCWNAEPVARPTFNRIIQKLDDMLNCLNNPKDTPTIYSEVEKDLSTKSNSPQNVCSDESYLKPL